MHNNKWLSTAPKLFILSSALSLSVTATASTLASQPGTLLTQGPISTNTTGLSTLYNPAAGELVIAEDDSLRWGYLTSLGFNLEIGDVENFDTEVEQLIDDLDLENIDLNTAQDIINRYNAIRPALATEGYVKGNANFIVPIAPFSFRSETLGGVVSVNTRLSGDFNARFLDDDLRFADPDNDGNGELETNSALYLKGAETTHIGLGYSRDISEIGFIKNALESTSGKLIAGASLNFYRIELSKQVIALNEVDEDEELADIIDDNYEDNQESASGLGLDLGLVWQDDHLQLGLAWRNINEPEFDYGVLGGNCPVGDVNCETANFFSNRIDLSETYTMDSQLTGDLTVFTEDKHWQFSGSYDFNEVFDPVGDEFQWFTLSAGYHSGWFSTRLGYSKNTVGSELDALNAGFSIGVFNLDIRYGLDSVSYDGEEAPRTVGINLGLESRF